jgi:hypothetical protein
VVETTDHQYLIEAKAADKTEDAQVQAKALAAVE